MIPYKEYEKAVYDWLKAKRNKDQNFTFSLRLNGLKGAELDYFIGTEKSKYFATTFWSIPVFFAGSSSDLIDVVFSYSKANHFGYHFDFKQTKNPTGTQNQAALELVKLLKSELIRLDKRYLSSNDDSKMEWCKIRSQQEDYQDLDSLFTDLHQDMERIIPLVDQKINEIKLTFPDFKASRISNLEFENFEQKLNRRIRKYTPAAEQSNEITFGKVMYEPNDFIDPPLNQILFGPPGTGKTFHTINKAIEIIAPEYYEQNKTDRSIIRDLYKEQLITDWNTNNGQISFCTFHQSFSYEDFVEGIKPQKPNESDTHLKYAIEDGIFKRMCLLAERNLTGQSIQNKELISFTDDEFQRAQFYKLSLGDFAEQETKALYNYWKENNVISIGFGDGLDFTGKNETEVITTYQEKYKDDFGANAINLFKNYLKVGNYVVISKGNLHIRAIGKVTGEYYYDPTTEVRHKNFRKVQWIFNDQEIPVQDIYTKSLSPPTIYKMKSEWIQKSFFVNSSVVTFPEDGGEQKNYVLIIDEINRGNVASIFGELITLIEPDKRSGNNEKETLEVILPYSKQKFKVPSNLYIIGTMNTADRSIEALDTALRRRFSFKEMPPKPELIRSEGSLSPTGMIEDIDVVKLLSTINDRIEKLIDKDHKIGHAYFMELETIPDLKLAFKDKVIPLLEEYFFGDYGKIGLVLGDSFVEKSSHEKFAFASFNAYDGQMRQDLKERAIYIIKPSDSWNFLSVYTQTSS